MAPGDSTGGLTCVQRGRYIQGLPHSEGRDPGPKHLVR